MKLSEAFQNQVNVILESMRASFPLKEIEAELREKHILKNEISRADFEIIFWSYLYAQASLHWTRCCIEHAVDSKEIQQFFFKTVLEKFSGKDDLERAANFSEALYAANSQSDQEPLISIVAAFFKKIGVKETLSAGEIAHSFQWMASIWEGYCNHFDNEFDDFIAQLRMREDFSSQKRGKHG